MKKQLAVFYTIFCCINIMQYPGQALAQVQSLNTSNDTLYWDKAYRLTWDDFKGVPDTNSINRAVTFSGLITQPTYTSDTSISVLVKAIFYRRHSWINEIFRDSLNTLNHEQRHFDITEIFARKATNAFKKYKYNPTTVNVNKDIDSIFTTFIFRVNKMHKEYDKETTMPINYKKQKQWDIKIDGWLQSTE